MDMADRKEYEGPRVPTEQQWDAVQELTRAVFFPKVESFEKAMRMWPMALRPDVREDTLVMFGDGRPVSVIGRLERDMLVYGHRLRMGFIGGVCTDPDHREKGLAGTILAAMMTRFREDDVDFVYISGGRGLYLRAGADRASIETRFVLEKGDLDGDDMDVQLRSATAEDIDLLGVIAERESVRFVRPRLDYELIVAYRHCCGQPCAFHLVEMQGVPVGYLLLRAGKPDETAVVLEVAGDRLCVRAALGKVLQDLEEGQSLEVNVPHGDLLADLLRALDVQGEMVKTGGTIKVIDFPRTMRKLDSYFRERVDGWSDLELTAGSERYAAWNDLGSLEIDGESNMLRMLLGAPPDAPVEGMKVYGGMAELVERCLPVPVPSVYLNMI